MSFIRKLSKIKKNLKRRIDFWDVFNHKVISLFHIIVLIDLENFNWFRKNKHFKDVFILLSQIIENIEQ